MKRAILTVASLVLGAGIAGAEIAPADVKYDDAGAVAESLTGAAGDAAAGRAVIGSKKLGNCVSCHAISEMSDVPFHGEVGPLLDGVADRWNEAELRGIVANAKNTYDGTMMPSFYKTTGYIRPGDAFTGKAAQTDPLPPLLSAQQIEDVVAYLMTLKD
ncbi:sulfur oxidation c-type cytochrome SoxX [Actibacterium sp. XHP0104]|uniref:sulfur oxidation c-type cytochrome SoxX n=1 Tax=Actibacterium sp. XHP0104 TaxID=2984335 RepID=UPI0021E75BB7|nr:sulfur oxidation c-type cytochrome SoxX [Actibacterium sp. XHP0104]MCV2881472.1 sulfur oxidation c-type cytochrome SoxX [Actibacterium sp. XHP0104]